MIITILVFENGIFRLFSIFHNKNEILSLFY